jgi:hypothetical protein
MRDRFVLRSGDPERTIARDRVLRLAAAGGAAGEVTRVIEETLPGEVLPTDSLAEHAWLLHLIGLALATLTQRVVAADGRNGLDAVIVIREVLDRGFEK